MANGVIYMIKVEPGANNNKFYKMTPHPENSTFSVEYGRIGQTPSRFEYPMSDWDKKLKEKIKKGYVDETHLIKQVSSRSSEHKEISDTVIARLVDRLMKLAKVAIEKNYTVSSNSVTQAMIDEAQYILSELSSSKNLEYFNTSLVKLFRVIPRRMDKVADNLARSSKDFGEIVQREQDLLDVMRTQVEQDIDDTEATPEKTILETLGLTMSKTSNEDVHEIKTLLGESASRYVDSWIVENHRTREKFNSFISSEKVKIIKPFWHGSRSENWWSIINSGLLLRPNAVITGKMFGNGIYFAPKAQKSIGYTSVSGSYWVSGSDSSGFMGIYDVAYGTPYDVYSRDGGFSGFDYNALKRRNKDANCLHAHAGRGMLRNDEVVVYKEEQVTIKYLVEIK